MKKNLSSIILVLVFFTGLSVLLYPAISDYVNSKSQSKAVANYDRITSNMKEDDCKESIEKAHQYNERLYDTNSGFTNTKALYGYEDILNVSKTGIMGYISINKIKVELPIYHGTDEGILQVASGHLEGSSLPVGGKNTHSVLSAHRGLPSAKLFTNLDKLEIGDTFNITILDQVMTYEVDQILIVEPHEIDELKIIEGEDYCTLVTCTPYAINTHRLLVRGKRCENIRQKAGVFVSNEAYIIDPLIVVPAVAAPMLLVLLVYLLVKYRKNR